MRKPLGFRSVTVKPTLDVSKDHHRTQHASPLNNRRLHFRAINHLKTLGLRACPSFGGFPTLNTTNIDRMTPIMDRELTKFLFSVGSGGTRGRERGNGSAHTVSFLLSPGEVGFVPHSDAALS